MNQQYSDGAAKPGTESLLSQFGEPRAVKTFEEDKCLCISHVFHMYLLMYVSCISHVFLMYLAAYVFYMYFICICNNVFSM